MALSVDFTSQDYLRDPAAGIERLRSGGPVVQARFPIVGSTWITTTEDVADRVLKDGKVFTLRRAMAPSPACDGGCPACSARWPTTC